MNLEKKIQLWIENNTGRWKLSLILIALSTSTLQFYMFGHENWISRGISWGFLYAIIFLLVDHNYIKDGDA